MAAATIEAWKRKMSRGVLDAPKLCSLPPTRTAFVQNSLRAHYQLAVWKAALEENPPSLNPCELWWQEQEGSNRIFPTIVPADISLAPPDLVKIVRCGCSSTTPCQSKRCGCRSHGLLCTMFCACRGEDCWNKEDTWTVISMHALTTQVYSIDLKWRAWTSIPCIKYVILFL